MRKEVLLAILGFLLTALLFYWLPFPRDLLFSPKKHQMMRSILLSPAELEKQERIVILSNSHMINDSFGNLEKQSFDQYDPVLFTNTFLSDFLNLLEGKRRFYNFGSHGMSTVDLISILRFVDLFKDVDAVIFGNMQTGINFTGIADQNIYEALASLKEIEKRHPDLIGLSLPLYNALSLYLKNKSLEKVKEIDSELGVILNLKQKIEKPVKNAVAWKNYLLTSLDTQRNTDQDRIIKNHRIRKYLSGADVVRHNFKISKEFRKKENIPFVYDIDLQKWPYFKIHLQFVELLKALLKKKNIPLVFYAPPDFCVTKEEYETPAFQRYTKTFVEEVRKLQVPVINHMYEPKGNSTYLFYEKPFNGKWPFGKINCWHSNVFGTMLKAQKIHKELDAILEGET